MSVDETKSGVKVVVKEVFVEEEDEIKLISPGTVMNLDVQI